MDFQTFSCVDASTGHITEQDNELLQKDDLPGLIVYPYDYGFFVYLSEDETKESILSSGFSGGFVYLFEQARDTGAKFLNLDCDGPIYPELPQFNW